MEQQPFYIGQEVVCIKTCILPDCVITEGKVYTVLDIIYCNQWYWMVDVGLRSPNFTINCKCGCTENYIGVGLVKSIAFAPIESARTKYVVKEVEVAPQIRELEKCNN